MRPEARQRNRALRAADVASASTIEKSAYNREALTPWDLGFPRHDQLRVLVCDGPVLLAWIGGTRERRRFTARDQRALAELIPVLRTRMAMERRLRLAHVHHAAFDVLMMRLRQPAVLANQMCAVETANNTAAALIDCDPLAFRERLRATLRGEGTGFDAYPVDVRGGGRRWLFVARAQTLEDADRLIAHAIEWKLTPREKQIASMLARGLSSKEIAAALGCALGTVHVHVGHVLRKAGVDTRAKLAAKIWGET